MSMLYAINVIRICALLIWWCWSSRNTSRILSFLFHDFGTNIDEFHMVLGGQPTPCFFTAEFAKSNFYPPSCRRKWDCAKHVRWGRREIRINLFGARYSKLLVPTCFAISGYPWHWVETKWRWLATQDHAKLVYRAHRAPLQIILHICLCVPLDKISSR